MIQTASTRSRTRRLSALGSLLASGVLLASPALAQESFSIDGSEGTALTATPLADFEEPWAMTFLPDGSMLVTEKAGTLQHVSPDGTKTAVEGMFDVAYGGQGGFGDVVVSPDFEQSNAIYLSYAESLDDGATFGAAVARAVLDTSGGTPKLTDVTKIWEQEPHVPGNGHYSHRIAFGPEGSDQEGFMFITSGDRQKQTPAQDMDKNLGKIVRLNLDGSVPADNPFQDQGDLAKQFWTVGNRNLLGIAFDGENRLWETEMGPRGGDELNLVTPGSNYGWPEASNGVNYSGVSIPDHDPSEDGFAAPKVSWVPSISPAGLIIYDGETFADWQGDAFLGALSGRALVHVDIEGESASEAERFSWDKRVREVEQGPDGAIWVLEDGNGGRLIKLTPADEAS
ncbi:PQQ-dependent sugar dehydrogenase [Fulvimarina sp. 2208YS6-2-32]|uniref:PQQ-dependent sugar dehydrogenase n=1 Tax=Fulvimarina uroteuthidis TaxID=3098149 RepID=A0ABU5I043_9HYPH|nr:PQQ-dependent sugar dehydrogenase [Fulvimarina sp. 2208YS6-2-32]MDY8108749.1 PQQ-dependent sugar dehydrogenase [Fulvimarina sp. 2208YS6-2-32]